MRQLTLAFALLIPLGLGLAGCDKGDDHGHDHDHGKGGDHSHNGHDHDKGDGNGKGEDHTDAHDTEIKIGPITVGDYTVNIVSFTDMKPGTTGHLDVIVSDGDIGAVRLWAGDAEATGVAKDLAERTVEPGKFHGHVEIPDPIGEAKLWVEIEDAASGERVAGSVAIGGHGDHDHDHDDHDHEHEDHDFKQDHEGEDFGRPDATKPAAN